MAQRRSTTIGEEHAAQLDQALADLANVPVEGARDLPILAGLLGPAKQGFTIPSETVVLNAINLMDQSSRVMKFGNAVVFETPGNDHSPGTITYLRTGVAVESAAAPVLANAFVCRTGDVEFPPPGWLVRQLLLSDHVTRLPRIKTYSSRPVFDEDFRLFPTGWHPEAGILVHGPGFEPTMTTVAYSPDSRAMDRLPPHLRRLLGGFCFASDADVANTVAMFVTGVMANHFIEEPKGLFVIDGNQPGLGKTWLARCLGIVLDGRDPRFIAMAEETELEKRLGAMIRARYQSLIFIDNAKTAKGQVISSPVIEANSVAPEISARILCTSNFIIVPNDRLWVITMNNTKLSPDLTSRCVPIRLAFEGQPKNRVFSEGQPLEYAKDHRLDILAELAGIVLRWNQQGRPPGNQQHRSTLWAARIGGILHHAGFPEFLANADEAASAFNSELEQLAALAEAALIQPNGPYRVITLSEDHQ